MHHDLKLMAGYWEPKMDGRKPWEFRSTDDRDFQVGDTVTFHEVTHNIRREPTGRISGTGTITYLLMVSDDRCVFTHTPVN